MDLDSSRSTNTYGQAPTLPLSATTGYATEASLMPARLPVPAAILDKPYGMKVLAQKLRAILDQKRE